jgi:hypothetical protein
MASLHLCQKKNFRIKKVGALYVREGFKPRPFPYMYHHIMLEYKQRLFYMHDNNDFGAFEIIKLT